MNRVTTTVMHEAAGCLELLYSLKSLLSLPDTDEGENNKNKKTKKQH